MNLNQVQVFCTVAKHLSYSMAAEELFITQPAVSQQVKALERQLNVKLFERVGANPRSLRQRDTYEESSFTMDGELIAGNV